MSHDPNAAGIVIHWQEFGSNGHETADYSKDVLERFTRRAKKDFYGTFKDSKGTTHTLGNVHLKTIANPRLITLSKAHRSRYFEGFYSIDERGVAIQPKLCACLPIAADKIVINHYRCKSKEEFLNKINRGFATNHKSNIELFESFNNNDEFDDGILRYRAERAKTYQPPDKSRADERLLNALMKNLSPALLPTTPPEFFAGKMETFLTCRAVSSYLKTKLPDATAAKFFEEASLKAILRTFGGMTLADARIFLRELPQLLSLPYPVVKDIRNAAVAIIPQILNVFHMNSMWNDYISFDYLQDILKLNK